MEARSAATEAPSASASSSLEEWMASALTVTSMTASASISASKPSTSTCCVSDGDADRVSERRFRVDKCVMDMPVATEVGAKDDDGKFGMEEEADDDEEEEAKAFRACRSAQ